jgi:glycosyltransferase involved in cell wall biosynthesis
VAASGTAGLASQSRYTLRVETDNELISVILPVRNQADHIRRIVDSYRQVLGRLTNPVELILVVNNSQDGSLATCTRIAGEFPMVVVSSIDEPGWGRAVRAGLKIARGSLLCYTNSARTSAEDLVLILLYAVVNPNVVIKANRKIRDNVTRRLGSLIYNLECRALFDLPNWDVNGTPKVFPRQFDGLLALTRNDDLIDAEFSIICRRRHYPMLEVPILSTRRHGGRSTTNYRSALKMYWGAFRLWESTRSPLHAGAR